MGAFLLEALLVAINSAFKMRALRLQIALLKPEISLFGLRYFILDGWDVGDHSLHL